MPRKYHVSVKTAPPRFHPVGKYSPVEFREDCAGSCRRCVKKSCVYGIFKENQLHVSTMAEPEYLYTCQSCFRCVQECTRGIFSRAVNPEYRNLGDDYWQPDTIHRSWYQAHTGKVPVSGAGYRGPFVGPGFDSMWTDMSEIVRPTRDGIHGREYINTGIELSRRVTPLPLTADFTLASRLPEILEIPIPALLRLPGHLTRNESIALSAAKAAKALETLFILDPSEITNAMDAFSSHLVPSVTAESYTDHVERICVSRAVELSDAPGVESIFSRVRALRPGLVLIVRLPLDEHAASRTVALARAGVDSVHLEADDHGNGRSPEGPRFLKEMIREVHLALVKRSIRQKVNLIFSGGMAMAEHMAKAVICGADGVAVDTVLMLALECRMCGRCARGRSCPVALDDGIDPEWGAQRMVNLLGAWHSQLIEVMGAMGIREARRLRGEVGRSMRFEDLEAESFGPLFGTRKIGNWKLER
jgi:ferredoxin